VASNAVQNGRVRAQARWVRTSARKARLVVDHIRGRSVPEARTVLAFTQRAAAREVEKVLRSAVANAEANHGLVGDDLIVAAAFVDEGPTLKRWQFRARGRIARIKKRTCHITVELAELEHAGRPRRRPAATQSKAAEPKRIEKAEETEQPEEKPKRASRARKPKAKEAAT
jgi:ribosomal protein L22